MPAPSDAEIDRLLTAALALRAEERGAYLDEACAHDAELRTIMERAIRAALSDDGPLTIGGAGRGAILHQAEAILIGADEGQRVGPWRVLREIGRGGMGVVYLAERADGAFEQQVALKIVPLGASPETAERLVAERRIQAGLTHPGIAKVLDGGVSEEGHPYLAMEYVQGTPIDAYCDTEDLSMRRRLSLFIDVCRAVEAAHTQLIVHRDLKPSNILVDDDGQVRLLDFGIAKLLSVDEVRERTATWIMTPEYSSPEQIRGQPVSLASDVYQLGLLLYRLLTGEKPYTVQGKPPAEAERIICEEGVRLPSAVTGGTRLKGDLDTIALKALRKEPERRYGSAEALRRDVERYLDEVPIEARPATLRYRAYKFVRRYPWGVAATVAVLLFGGVYALTLTAERNRAESARDEAETARASAESLSDFLVDVFQGADPVRSPADVTARTLVDRAAARLGERTDLDPLARARFQHTIGGIYVELALLDDAEALLEQALATRQAALPEDDKEVLGTMIELALVRQRAGKLDDAEPLLRDVIARSERSDSPDSVTLGRAYNELGDVLRARQSYEEAEPYVRRALAIREAVIGPEHPDVANSLNSLATIVRHLGRTDEAADLYHRALGIYERELGPDHMNVATVLFNMGLLLRDEDPDSAEVVLRRSLAIREARFGPDHAVLASPLRQLARLRRSAGDVDSAIVLQRRAVDIMAAGAGENDENVLDQTSVLRGYLTGVGRWRDAAAVLRPMIRALHATEPRSAFLAGELEWLGISLGWLGQVGDAQAAFREALDIREELDPEAPVVLRLRGSLAWLDWRRGRFAAAESGLRAVLGDMDAAGVNSAGWVLQPSLFLGLSLSQMGRHAEAEAAVRTALGEKQERYGSDDPLTALGQVSLATVLRRAGRLDEAEAAVQRALDVLDGVEAHPHFVRERAREELARIRTARGSGP